MERKNLDRRRSRRKEKKKARKDALDRQMHFTGWDAPVGGMHLHTPFFALAHTPTHPHTTRTHAHWLATHTHPYLLPPSVPTSPLPWSNVHTRTKKWKQKGTKGSTGTGRKSSGEGMKTSITTSGGELAAGCREPED